MENSLLEKAVEQVALGEIVHVTKIGVSDGRLRIRMSDDSMLEVYADGSYCEEIGLFAEWMEEDEIEKAETDTIWYPVWEE